MKNTQEEFFPESLVTSATGVTTVDAVKRNASQQNVYVSLRGGPACGILNLLYLFFVLLCVVITCSHHKNGPRNHHTCGVCMKQWSQKSRRKHKTEGEERP